jgi:hypothetical protein
MTPESKCKVRIQSEIIEPAGATLGLSIYSLDKLPLCPLPDDLLLSARVLTLPPSRRFVVECQSFNSAPFLSACRWVSEFQRCPQPYVVEGEELNLNFIEPETYAANSPHRTTFHFQ